MENQQDAARYDANLVSAATKLPPRRALWASAHDFRLKIAGTIVTWNFVKVRVVPCLRLGNDLGK